MSGNIGLPAEKAQSLQVSFSYDLNLLQTLKAGDERFSDRSRERTTQTYLLQIGYQLSNRIALEALIPYIIQRRTIRQFGESDVTQTFGPGDLALLGKYTLVDSQSWTFRAGVGVKLTTGRSNIKLNGITLNADLQPGSGANDLIIWSGVNHSMSWRKSMTVNFIGFYRMTGVNDDYLNTLTYEFGNELSVMLGLADQFIGGSLLLSPSFSLRYRHAQEDLQNDFMLPNTGGNFLFFRPGLLLNWWPDLSFSIYSELPLFADVGGVQLSPTTRFNVGLLWTLDFNNDENF